MTSMTDEKTAAKTTQDEAAQADVSPMPIVEAMFAFRKTAAIKAAIELDLFSALCAGADTTRSLASATGASERGLRVLCDFLTVEGFLTKRGERYAPAPHSSTFLDRRSPAYMGAAVDFVAAPEMIGLFLDDPASYVRNGGSVGLANISADNPIWVRFARAMGSFTGASAHALATEVAGWPVSPKKVLDIAAGPGRFGIEIARIIPSAQITGVDWRAVLDLSEENARQAGVGARYRGIAGSAFEVDWGRDYDLILLPNFLHHFDMETCIGLMKKIKASLTSGGRVAVVEFPPNDDRVSPPFEAAFAFQMLANTPAGDAYTIAELKEMGTRAGFTEITVKQLPHSPASLIFYEMPPG